MTMLWQVDLAEDRAAPSPISDRYVHCSKKSAAGMWFVVALHHAGRELVRRIGDQTCRNPAKRQGQVSRAEGESKAAEATCCMGQT